MAGLSLVVATMALRSLGPSMYERLAGGLIETLSELKRFDLTPDIAATISADWALLYARTFFPFVAVLATVGVLAGLLQGGFAFSLKPMMPDFNRINPAAGFSRIFALRTVVDLVKSLLKLAIVGAIAYRDIAALFPLIPTLMSQNVALGVATIASSAVSGLQSIGFGLLALGVLDYGYQYWEFRKSLRMTKQEVKQEHKEQDGSPELKSKQRQRQREMARRRKALKDVPTADVVITNPTHFAIAIKYQMDEGSAPRVVAKGADLLAQRIKVIAKKHAVPLVENRPLARTLYATVDVGKTVPPGLYQAMAEVLAFVYSLKRQKRRGSTVSIPPAH